ncbi:MAG TPA: isocitrate lyase/phosphoenolpyruvate mutase family protein [Tepidisphaeraceae bacterium]|nr:isocitrate lyase/phosphoenolpyruvate mutase family protein [Tepidisphaeraceae bacterium]
MAIPSPGQRFREAVERERPLQVVGTINAYAALLAERAGFGAIYLSGAGVANASIGVPDLAITTLDDVLTDVRRITRATRLPLLVDGDTGFGSALNIARTVGDLIQAGAAAVHLEDQVTAKRCGHRPGKALVEAEEMVDRLRAAVEGRATAEGTARAGTRDGTRDGTGSGLGLSSGVGSGAGAGTEGEGARADRHGASAIAGTSEGAGTNQKFVIMARTDAHAVEGLSAAIARSQRYVDAGADMIFAEALTTLEEYRTFTAAVGVPVLANLTEFGRTPLFALEDLAAAGVRLALYPLTAFRAMSFAAARAYQTLRRDGTQKSLLDQMQTREQLYDILGYHAVERRMDEMFERRAEGMRHEEAKARRDGGTEAPRE